MRNCINLNAPEGIGRPGGARNAAPCSPGTRGPRSLSTTSGTSDSRTWEGRARSGGVKQRVTASGRIPGMRSAILPVIASNVWCGRTRMLKLAPPVSPALCSVTATGVAPLPSVAAALGIDVAPPPPPPPPPVDDLLGWGSRTSDNMCVGLSDSQADARHSTHPCCVQVCSIGGRGPRRGAERCCGGLRTHNCGRLS